jgi:hypothetical protein
LFSLDREYLFNLKESYVIAITSRDSVIIEDINSQLSLY